MDDGNLYYVNRVSRDNYEDALTAMKTNKAEQDYFLSSPPLGTPLDSASPTSNQNNGYS